MTNPYDAMVFGGMYCCAKQINILMSTGEMERLTGQQETTSRQIHHGDLSGGMRQLFCSLPSYSAFQLMSPLFSPSLAAITHGLDGITKTTDVLHTERVSPKSGTNKVQRETIQVT